VYVEAVKQTSFLNKITFVFEYTRTNPQFMLKKTIETDFSNVSLIALPWPSGIDFLKSVTYDPAF
jgi:hypothetical protein